MKGYLTNTDLPAKEVYEQYTGLWVIERAYRITKGTLELRPMFHFHPNVLRRMFAFVLSLTRFIKKWNVFYQMLLKPAYGRTDMEDLQYLRELESAFRCLKTD